MMQRVWCRVWSNSSTLRLFFSITTIAITAVSVVFLQTLPVRSIAQPADRQFQEQLPALQIHPLPSQLKQWQDNRQGNYFAAIQSTPVGFLIWSRFPIRVFVEPPSQMPTVDRSQDWVDAVAQAVQEWQVYLPLERVNSQEQADISIWRSTPPLRQSNSQTTVGNNQGLRAQAAETRYELFVDRSTVPAILSHRFTVRLRSGQTKAYILASARHELGHALGIWGHSPSPTDVMYFSQIRNPPAISERDINTLKQIYQQPTRLGWSVSGK
ncbi:MAG TPA: matrixin family metalloprotease [Trichocoleus sp.]|jgi:predicted Zn-dependent protease